MTSDLLVEETGGVAVVTLDRPHVRNALSSALRAELDRVLADLDAEPAVVGIVLTGAGSAFCAGVDLRELRGDPTVAATIGPRDRPVLRCGTPLVGAVNGPAYTGGLELALACHFLVAAEEATFADTHARLGFLPGWGLTVLLAEAVGVRRARQMSATGEPVDARTALAWGLVNEVVPQDSLRARAVEVARTTGDGDHGAVRAVLDLYDRQVQTRDREAWALEMSSFRPLTAHGGGEPG